MKYKIEGRVKHITEMQLAKSRRLETIGQMTKFIFLGELRGKGNYNFQARLERNQSGDHSLHEKEQNNVMPIYELFLKNFSLPLILTIQ